MPKYKAGDIVLIPFPFTDLSNTKLRPALALFVQEDDGLFWAITSQNKWPHASALLANDLELGALPVDSFVRLDKISSLNLKLIRQTVAHVAPEKMMALRKSFFEMLTLA